MDWRTGARGEEPCPLGTESHGAEPPLQCAFPTAIRPHSQASKCFTRSQALGMVHIQSFRSSKPDAVSEPRWNASRVQGGFRLCPGAQPGTSVSSSRSSCCPPPALVVREFRCFRPFRLSPCHGPPVPIGLRQTDDYLPMIFY